MFSTLSHFSHLDKNSSPLLNFQDVTGVSSNVDMAFSI